MTRLSRKTLILIPAYNEESNIATVLNNIRRECGNVDILVINDGSHDRTAQVAKNAGATVVSHIYNMGYGVSLQTGYKYAVDHDYEFIIQIDADGQHDVCNIGTIYKELSDPYKHYDIVIGSRFLADDNEMKVGFAKRIAISFFNMAIRLVTHKHFTDPTSGLQGLSRRAFTAYSLYGNFDTNYPDANIITKMLLNGYKLKEVPAVMHIRKSGKSMHSGLMNNIRYMFTVTLNIVVVVMQFHIIKKGRKDIADSDVSV
ncbi:MAG: glycosyltransferase family 2 protein [Acutalibacteraceae bacterium]